MPRLRRANTCKDTVNRALEWILARLEPDGSFGKDQTTLLACHKAPAMFTFAGKVEESRRCLDWLATNLRLDDGSFRPLNNRLRVNTTAWLGLGAQLNGQFDLSFSALRFVVEMQGSQSGGVYELIGDEKAPGFDLQTTSSAGLAFLYCGMLEEARQAGRCLCQILRSQPEKDRFFACFDHHGTRVLPTLGQAPEDFFIEKSAVGQRYAFVGVPAGFLAKLYRATLEEEFLDAAEGYLDVAADCASDAWASVDAASVAWGASVFYHMTRSRRHLDHAEKVVGYLIDNQNDDGSWTLGAAASPSGSEAKPVALNAVIATTLALLECLREVQ